MSAVLFENAGSTWDETQHNGSASVGMREKPLTPSSHPSGVSREFPLEHVPSSLHRFELPGACETGPESAFAG